MSVKNTLFVCLPPPHNTSNIDTPLSGRLSVISGTDIGCPDRKTLYIKVAQNGSLNTNTIPATSPHPSNIPNIEPPLRTVSPMICPVLLQYPDEFISNTKVDRNESTNPDTQATRVSDVHDTSGLIFPPLRTPCPVITRSRYSSTD